MEPGTGTGTGMVVRVPGNSFPFPLQLYTVRVFAARVLSKTQSAYECD